MYPGSVLGVVGRPALDEWPHPIGLESKAVLMTGFFVRFPIGPCAVCLHHSSVVAKAGMP